MDTLRLIYSTGLSSVFLSENLLILIIFRKEFLNYFVLSKKRNNSSQAFSKLWAQERSLWRSSEFKTFKDKFFLYRSMMKKKFLLRK